MPDSRTLPVWAEDLRRRYLRGEASRFVLHGKTTSLLDSQIRARIRCGAPEATGPQ